MFHVQPQNLFLESFQVGLAALEHFYSTPIVSTSNMLIGDPNLKHPLVQVTMWTGCVLPGCFQVVVSPIIGSLVEQTEAYLRLRVQVVGQGVSFRFRTHW